MKIQTLAEVVHRKSLLLMFLIVSAPFVTVLMDRLPFGSAIKAVSASEIQSAPLPVVYVDPPEVTGDYFTISVKIANVTNLWMLTIQFAWGSQVLEFVDREVNLGTAGWLLNKPVLIFKDEVDVTAGTYTLGAASMAPASPYTGSGLAFKMTFARVMEGECWLYFIATDLGDKEGKPILHEKRDGYFYWPGKGSVPEAEYAFGPTPPYTYVVINRTAVTFNASASYDPDEGGAVTEYYWNFGDGNLETTYDPIASHTYFAREASHFIVSLSVLDVEGSQSKIKYQTVHVVHPRPVANFTWQPEKTFVGQGVTFNASASYDPDPLELGGGIIKYYWIFGDGTESTTTTPIIPHTFTYAKPEGFTVILTVWDTEDYASYMVSRIIKVEPTPVSISIYTDKYSYSVRDTMHLGLNVTNSLDRAITVCIAIGIELPDGSIYRLLHAHAVILPAHFRYSNPDFKTFVLPRIPPGIYAWHAAMLDPATHAVLVMDTAEWQFT